MSEHEPKPVAWMHPKAKWADADYDKVRVHCLNDGPLPEPLYPASVVTALQEEVRKHTFRADSNHRIMLNHAEASSAKSVEIQNLKAYIDKMTAEVKDAIGRERKRAEAAEKRALDNEARANAAEQRLRQIAGSDDIENALDPEFNKRVAAAYFIKEAGE